MSYYLRIHYGNLQFHPIEMTLSGIPKYVCQNLNLFEQIDPWLSKSIIQSRSNSDSIVNLPLSNGEMRDDYTNAVLIPLLKNISPGQGFKKQL